MSKLIALAIGIYIGREIFTNAARQEELKRRKVIWKNMERYIRENHPELSAEELKRKMEAIMLS